MFCRGKRRHHRSLCDRPVVRSISGTKNIAVLKISKGRDWQENCYKKQLELRKTKAIGRLKSERAIQALVNLHSIRNVDFAFLA